MCVICKRCMLTTSDYGGHKSQVFEQRDVLSMSSARTVGLPSTLPARHVLFCFVERAHKSSQHDARSLTCRGGGGRGRGTVCSSPTLQLSLIHDFPGATAVDRCHTSLDWLITDGATCLLRSSRSSDCNIAGHHRHNFSAYMGTHIQVLE